MKTFRRIRFATRTINKSVSEQFENRWTVIVELFERQTTNPMAISSDNGTVSEIEIPFVAECGRRV